MNKKEEIMKIVIDEAQKGLKESNAPFAAVVVDKNWNIVSKAHNMTKVNHDPTAHAEILALREAGIKNRSRDLSGYKIFTNAEPCAMCASAIVKTGIKEIYTGVLDKKIKDTELKAKDILKYAKEKILFEDGILEEEAKKLLDGR